MTERSPGVPAVGSGPQARHTPRRSASEELGRQVRGHRRRREAAATAVPALVEAAGATQRFREFVVAQIPNTNTRAAYARAVGRFLAWCDHSELSLTAIDPDTVAVYVEAMRRTFAPQTAKQHLAAIRRLFDWLVTCEVVPFNPAAAVRFPQPVAATPKSKVLSTAEARRLLSSIDEGGDVVQLRDRALIAAMTYSFGRISALLGIRVKDYHREGKRRFLRLHERGGSREIPVHHKLEEILDAYIAAAGIAGDGGGPLFRSVRRGTRQLSPRALDRTSAFLLIRRRAFEAGLGKLGCHTLRATGIAAYLQNGGTLETAQQLAGHADPRTTKRYVRATGTFTIGESENIPV